MRTKLPVELSEAEQEALNDALLGLARRARNPPWRRIVSAPKDGRDILVYVPSSNLEAYKNFTAVARWVGPEYDGTAGWFDNFDKIYPTHWMEIPEYPK
jgi:hypothetical protein